MMYSNNNAIIDDVFNISDVLQQCDTFGTLWYPLVPLSSVTDNEAI